MRLTIPHADLTTAIAAAASTVPAKPVHPVLGGLLLGAAESLFVSAYDYNTSISVRTGADVFEPGEALISGRLMAQVAKLLPKQPVTLAVGDGSKMLQISAGRASFGLPLMAADEFPTLPQPGAPTGHVSGTEFAAAVEYVAAAALKDDGNDVRQHLTGVVLYVDPESDGIQIVATDGYRVHWDAVDWTGNDGTALVPAKPLASITSVVGSSPEGIGLHLGQTFAVVAPGLERTIPTIASEPAPWRKPFAAEPVGTLTANAAEFVAALKRAGAMSDHHLVKLTPTDTDTVRITAGEAEGVSIEHVDVELAGDPPELTVNAAYLAEAVAGVGRTQIQITLTFTGAVRPILGNLDGARKFAVMPIRS